MRRAGYIIIITLMLAGCRKYNVPQFISDQTLPNVTIGDLRDMYNGENLTIADDIIISGRVVSSDKAGNFYNTFFIDDGTGSIEVMAGMPDLHATYLRGARVIIRAKGLAIGWGNGAMQMGLPPEPGSGFATGYFYHPTVIRNHVSRERTIENIAPIQTEIASLCGDMCGRLVEIREAVIDEHSMLQTWATTKPKPATGYIKFRTSPEDSITVVTSGYASFALMPIPRESITLTGIILYGKGGSSKNHFLLKLRDEKDITH